MSRLKRYPMPGHAYFVTNVTHRRNALLVNHADLFRRAFSEIRQRLEFDILAQVILPDHFHIIVDPHGKDISNLMQRIKMSFSSLLRKRLNMRSGRIWQKRFWDHIIRDERDMNHHINYIHFNPVKHGYVNRPFDWENTSIHEFRDYYPSDWGVHDTLEFDDDFGE